MCTSSLLMLEVSYNTHVSKILWYIPPLCNQHPCSIELDFLLLADVGADKNQGVSLVGMYLVRHFSYTSADIIVSPEWCNEEIIEASSRKQMRRVVWKWPCEGHYTICGNLSSNDSTIFNLA